MQSPRKLVRIKRANKSDEAKMISEYDILGSYTGVISENKFEMPIQDADDL